jgi:molybdopterin molybdotransferase
MLAVAEAQRRVWAAFGPLPAEWLSLDRALGRVLADDLLAKRDQPPQAVSAMDGYALRAADSGDPTRRLRIVGEVPAGQPWAGTIGPGEVVRIFTGGCIPDGADSILIQENAAADDRGLRCREPTSPGRFVRPRGLDFGSGWRGLAGGRRLDPLALGLAAAMGHHWLPVRRQPRVGLLATGDELRWPGETPGAGQIVSSNTTALAAMVRLWGGLPVDLGISPDRPDALERALAGAAGLDLLLTTGGASVGDYDVVRQVLGGQALELDFWKIAMRPGKPLIFGRVGDVPVLGLPGNPVSAAVCGLVFVRGALRRTLNLDPALPIHELPTAMPLPANDERQDYLRAKLHRASDGERVGVASRQDSSMFATLAEADALLIRPPLAGPSPEGAAVPILRLAELFTF